MIVLVVGSGGREHALVAALAASPSVTEVHAAPGNPGIARIAACHPVNALDLEGVAALARSLDAGLVVVGPEAPLVAGLADALRHTGIPVFGPGAPAARLEGSKAFAKEVMQAAGVPAAASFNATTMTEVRAALAALDGPAVVKADGLAAGKGVVVCDDAAEAEAAAAEMLVGGSLGDAGRTLVIEERLTGPEVSLLALCDGETAVPLAAAQDFKRIGDGDEGPNTGGMGAFSPIPGIGAVGAAEICDVVHVPVLRELGRRGIHFNGCLYAGLMLTPSGAKVLEFNVRFGDPETQALVPRIEGDFARRLLDAACGRLTRDADPLPPGRLRARRDGLARVSRHERERRRDHRLRRGRGVRSRGPRAGVPRRHRTAWRPARHGRRPRARRERSGRRHRRCPHPRLRRCRADRVRRHAAPHRHRRRGRAGRGLTLPLRPGDAARP